MALKERADALLAEAAAALASPPSRRWVSVGPPPADCEQLVVAVTSVTTTLPEPTSGLQTGVRSAVVEIVLDRCAPTISSSGAVPSAATLSAHHRALMDDVDALWLVASRASCHDRAPAGLVASTSGGITRVSVRLQLQW